MLFRSHGIRAVIITGDCNIEVVLSFVLVDNLNLLQKFLGVIVEYSLKCLSMGCNSSIPLREA